MKSTRYIHEKNTRKTENKKVLFSSPSFLASCDSLLFSSFLIFHRFEDKRTDFHQWLYPFPLLGRFQHKDSFRFPFFPDCPHLSWHASSFIHLWNPGEKRISKIYQSHHLFPRMPCLWILHRWNHQSQPIENNESLSGIRFLSRHDSQWFSFLRRNIPSHSVRQGKDSRLIRKKFFIHRFII